MLDSQDSRKRRCPRLGHPVRFQYCRTQADNRLCPRILDCWWETFDVATFLTREGCGEQLQDLQSATPAMPKLSSLAALIEKARAQTRAAEQQD